MANIADAAEQLSDVAVEMKKALTEFGKVTFPYDILKLKQKVDEEAGKLKKIEDEPLQSVDREARKIEVKNRAVGIVDEIVQKIDDIDRLIGRVTGLSRTLRTSANQLKFGFDPSDNAKKEQTNADKKTMLVEARKALRKGILTEKFADLKAGVTPQDFADVTYVYLSQSWRAYNTDDAMNSALVAAMMIGARDTGLDPNLSAGDVYQPYLMDTLERRQAIMKFMEKNDNVGNDAVYQVDMHWEKHFTSSAAEEARRGADEIRQLKIRLADTEAKLRNAQNNVFDLAMEMAAKIQAAQQKK